jgi:hypothetical protein
MTLREGDDRRRDLLRLLGQQRMARAANVQQLDAIAQLGLPAQLGLSRLNTPVASS